MNERKNKQMNERGAETEKGRKEGRREEGWKGKEEKKKERKQKGSPSAGHKHKSVTGLQLKFTGQEERRVSRFVQRNDNSWIYLL